VRNSKFTFETGLDIGRHRSVNQDRVVTDEPAGVVVLADGMGGHNAGEVASEMAANYVCKSLTAWLASVKPTTASRRLPVKLDELIRKADWKIFEAASLNPTLRGMGTTIVVAVVRSSRVVIGHVGDSRAYLFRNGALLQLTQDHSVFERDLLMGRVSAEDRYRADSRSILTRAVGVTGDVVPEVKMHALQPWDRILVCSDGLTEMLPDREIERIMKNRSSLVADELVSQANAAGGKDNISVVVINCEIGRTTADPRYD
jgi:serine/threonine protein phosphatase PrpC